jgi:glycosyltransferase involved in cell wall biosynthesis
MRILHTEASPGWGGQEIRILAEIGAMRRRGHWVALACIAGGMFEQRARDAGFPVFSLPFTGNFDIDSISGLHALVRRHAIEVVNSHSSVDSWCAALANLVRPRTVLVRTRHLSIAVPRHFFGRWLYRQPHALVTTGEALRQTLIDVNGMPPRNVLSIPTGVDLSRFDPARYERGRVRREFGIAEHEPLIGTIAILRSMKGHNVLLDAMPAVLARFPDCRFLWVGDVHHYPNYRLSLQKRAQELGVGGRLIFAGYRSDVPEILAALDLVVLPSTRDEGVPQSLTQALAMAKPAVATRVGAVGEIVRDGQTGVLVTPKDTAALAQGIIAQLADPERARALAANGRALVLADYDLDTMALNTERLYERLLAGRPAHP